MFQSAKIRQSYQSTKNFGCDMLLFHFSFCQQKEKQKQKERLPAALFWLFPRLFPYTFTSVVSGLSGEA